MHYSEERHDGWSHTSRRATRRSTAGKTALALLVATLGVTGSSSAPVLAQQPAVAPALVFDGVTVIDAQTGQRLPEQRVVIVGTRIQAMGPAATVPLPPGAQVVDAKGKYLIPGLWDMHAHPMSHATKVFYPLFIASGITGIRDASSPHPLAKLRRWRQEILAGTRVGPPRQLLSGPAIDDKQSGCSGSPFYVPYHICVSGPAEARRVVDSLKAAGADIIKTYNLRRDAYFAIAAEARRVGLPVGGHNNGVTSAFEASDSGVSILDHPHMAGDSVGGVASLCLGYRATLARCRPLAERFQRNGTWWVPTLLMAYVQNPEPSVGNWGWAFTVRGRKWLHASKNIAKRATAFGTAFVNDTTSAKDSAPVFDLQPDSVGVARTPGTLQPAAPAADGALEIAHSAGLPILAGTDEEWEQRFHLPIGFSLHAELAMYVAEGLTALEALQTATLNPAKMLHGTDSLGTVAPGKLADLVLLDANPLADITNTTKIRAVVANGRYFDRAALDQLVIGARAAMRGP